MADAGTRRTSSVAMVAREGRTRATRRVLILLLLLAE
jgi:hypothetical protein